VLFTQKQSNFQAVGLPGQDASKFLILSLKISFSLIVRALKDPIHLSNDSLQPVFVAIDNNDLNPIKVIKMID
jgi:hypothetical protein